MDYINGYELSKNWFNFSYENPELITPTHGILYFFVIEHCNRLGWKAKFGLPRQMAMDAIGIKNNKTFTKAFNDLVKWKFIKLIEKSTNQYSANIVAIVKNTPATTKALSKAMLKHSRKHVVGTVPIDKPINQVTIKPITLSDFDKTLEDFKKMRKKIKKPLTEEGVILLVKKLKKISSDEKEQIEILEQSIFSSWQGVFPLKEKTAKSFFERQL